MEPKTGTNGEAEPQPSGDENPQTLSLPVAPSGRRRVIAHQFQPDCRITAETGADGKAGKNLDDS